MTDVLDAGTDLGEQDRDGAWRQHQVRRINEAAAVASFGMTLDCHDCGNAIPQERRAAAPGCMRCIECEKHDERLRKLQGR